MPVTKAQQRAVGKYEKENYDKFFFDCQKETEKK